MASPKCGLNCRDLQLRGHLHGIVARNVVEKSTDSDVLDLESALDQMNNAFVQWNVDNYLR